MIYPDVHTYFVQDFQYSENNDNIKLYQLSH